MSLPKRTNNYPQKLQIGGKIVVIPQHTGIWPGVLAVQTHPKYWQNPLLWQPSRWISSSSTSGCETVVASRLHQEALNIPAQGTYFPWSAGPQNCPGAKFAQVEFVAVLARLFRDHRVEILREGKETFDEARKRALATTEDCDMELLLRMRNADKTRLVWKRV